MITPVSRCDRPTDCTPLVGAREVRIFRHRYVIFVIELFWRMMVINLVRTLYSVRANAKPGSIESVWYD